MGPDEHVQFLDIPPPGYARGWYVTRPDYEEIVAGPFASMSEAEKWLYETDLSPDPMRGVDFPFAENH